MGTLNAAMRSQWERDLFGGAYDDAAPADRPKYGVLDVMNDHQGCLCAQQYGDSYFVLKNTRLRCTFAPEDSGGMCSDKLAVVDQYAHVLLQYGETEFQEVVRVANAEEGSEDRIGDSFKLENNNYKEAQIHGELDLKKHVKRLVVNERHRSQDDDYGEAQIIALCRKHGWELAWMNEERDRRISEERRCLDDPGLQVSDISGLVIAGRHAEAPDSLEAPTQLPTAVCESATEHDNKICSNCANVLVHDAVFCRQCGTLRRSESMGLPSPEASRRSSLLDPTSERQDTAHFGDTN